MGHIHHPKTALLASVTGKFTDASRFWHPGNCESQGKCSQGLRHISSQARWVLLAVVACFHSRFLTNTRSKQLIIGRGNMDQLLWSRWRSNTDGAGTGVVEATKYCFWGMHLISILAQSLRLSWTCVYLNNKKPVKPSPNFLNAFNLS